MATHAPYPHQDKHSFLDGFTLNRGRLTTALILIALGIVFLLGQSGQLDYGSPWWVIFIAIPGLVTLGGAVRDYLDIRKMTSAIIGELAFGAVALLLSAIFIWDPTWSFTRGWRLGENFPILRSMDTLWPWLIVAVGVVILVRAWLARSWNLAVGGVIVCVIGFTFILKVSWNSVWPLLIIAAGISLLFARRSDQS